MQGVIHNQPFPGMVIGDYEVVAALGIIIFNLGVLVLIQEWSGLS